MLKSISSLIDETKHAGEIVTQALASAINTASDGELDRLAEEARELRYTISLRAIDAAHEIKVIAEDTRHQNATPSAQENIKHDIIIAQLNFKYQCDKATVFVKKTATFGISGKDLDVVQANSQQVLVDLSNTSNNTAIISSTSASLDSIEEAYALKVEAENTRHQNATSGTQENIMHDILIAQLNFKHQCDKAVVLGIQEVVVDPSSTSNSIMVGVSTSVSSDLDIAAVVPTIGNLIELE